MEAEHKAIMKETGTLEERKAKDVAERMGNIRINDMTQKRTDQ
jgi:hypothetical protein